MTTLKLNLIKKKITFSKPKIISNCDFEIEENTQSCLFLFNGKHSSHTKVRNCIFSGTLAPIDYYIDGESITNEKINFEIKSCTFSSDPKRAVNQKFIQVNVKNQVFIVNKNENKELNAKFV